MQSAKTSTSVQYQVSHPKTKFSILINAENGRDARSKTLSMFKGALDTTKKKLKRDDLTSARVGITELPARGRVKF